MKRLKKCMSLFLAGCLIFALVGCGNTTENGRTNANDAETDNSSAVNVPTSEPEGSEEENSKSEADQTPEIGEESTSDSHILIAYFSWADNAEEFDPGDIDADVLGHAVNFMREAVRT